jgi:hypothetical protein
MGGFGSQELPAHPGGRMRANLVIAVLLGVVVAAAACDESTSPEPKPDVAFIGNIDVTDHAGYGDTVKVTFNYYTAGCDTGVVVQTRPISDGLRFTVTSWPTNRVCPMTLTSSIIAPPPVGYVVIPPHPSPMRFLFTQPGGTDSVRVVGP